MVAAQAEREAAARRVRVERTRAIPDVTVSAGVRRFSGDDSRAVVAGISAPLPLFDQNRGNVNAAQGELLAAEARLNAARLDAEAELRTALYGGECWLIGCIDMGDGISAKLMADTAKLLALLQGAKAKKKGGLKK